MGGALAARLLETGDVVGFDIDPARSQSAAAGGVRVVDSLDELASRCTTVLLSLPRPEDSRDVLEAVLRAGGPGLVIETSTIGVALVRELNALAARAGVAYVDAAVLSGVEAVADGSSCFLIGGEHDDIQRALPALGRICARHIILGGPGAGMAAKVINNAVAHTVMVLISEAAALGRKADIELARICELLAQPDAGLLRPLEARLAGRYARQDFEGGMSTDAASKDSALALDMARTSGVPVFAIAAADAVYTMAIGSGMGRQDYAVIASLWEQWEERRSAEMSPEPA